MADAQNNEAFRHVALYCIETYGMPETRRIMKEAYAKAEAKGLGGASLREWIDIIRETAVARHPDTAHLWMRRQHMEKTDAISTN